MQLDGTVGPGLRPKQFERMVQPFGTLDVGILTCEEGCGCRFSQSSAYVWSVDDCDHYFCCSDCADTYAGRLTTETSEILRATVLQGQTAADIGCGSGYYTALLSGLVTSAGFVYAIDSRPERLARLEVRRAKITKGGEIRARVASADALTFIPDASVDFVLSNNVLCCINDRSSAVQEVARILRTGGSAYIRATRTPSENVTPISQDEWEMLLSRFRMVRDGGDDVTRWALLKSQRAGAPDSATGASEPPSRA